MITCPQCHNQFSANFDHCPLCREYQVPVEQRARHMIDNAVDWMETPETRHEFSRFLLEAGHSQFEVDELVRTTRASVGRENRKAGFSRLLLAAFIIGLGVFIVVAGIFAGSGRTSLAGLAIAASAIMPGISAVSALITGKD